MTGPNRPTHSALVKQMQAVADATHALHVHVHLITGAPPPEVPAVRIPTAGTPPKRGK